MVVSAHFMVLLGNFAMETDITLLAREVYTFRLSCKILCILYIVLLTIQCIQCIVSV